ncbi:MAG: DUF1566 domain-containing protein [Burkholderiaceae bacterium]|nr:DUF1566 domain-containing protein [Burkholderiaceae bacterium]
MKRAAIGSVVAASALAAGVAQADGVPGRGTWQTTLQPRDIDGDTVTDAFYDTVLDITWLRNANVDGLMDWATARSWVNTLVVGGVGGWRLPKVEDTGAPGCNHSYAGTDCGWNVDTATGEMAHLYYVTLGNKAYFNESGAWPQPGWGLTNTGGFQDLQSDTYWSGTTFATYPPNAWTFQTFDGRQSYDNKAAWAFHAMAVRPGDVPAVPEPQTYALMLMGVGTLVLALRRRPR